MMAKPDSDMEGTICKNCERPINDHLPEELEECLNSYALKAGNVIRKPIDGLLQYHQKKLQHSYQYISTFTPTGNLLT